VDGAPENPRTGYHARKRFSRRGIYAGVGALMVRLCEWIGEVRRLEACAECGGRRVVINHIILDSRYRMLEYAGEQRTPLRTSRRSKRRGRERWTGLENWEAGPQVMERYEAAVVVITRGRDGWWSFDHGHARGIFRFFGSDQVADVTGAGDTVIRGISAASAARGEPEEARAMATTRADCRGMKRGGTAYGFEGGKWLRADDTGSAATRPH